MEPCPAASTGCEPGAGWLAWGAGGWAGSGRNVGQSPGCTLRTPPPRPIMARSDSLPRGLPTAKGLRAPLSVQPPAGTDGETIFDMLEVIQQCPAASSHSKPVTPPPPPHTKSSSPIVHFHGTACLSFGGLASVVKNHYLCICLMSVSPENSWPHEDRSPVHLVHRCIPNTERSAWHTVGALWILLCQAKFPKKI